VKIYSSKILYFECVCEKIHVIKVVKIKNEQLFIEAASGLNCCHTRGEGGSNSRKFMKFFFSEMASLIPPVLYNDHQLWYKNS